MLRKHGDLIQKFKHAQQPKLFEAPKKKRQYPDSFASCLPSNERRSICWATAHCFRPRAEAKGLCTVVSPLSRLTICVVG